MKETIVVFVGGGLASISRLLVTKLYQLWQPTFPLATLTANFLSCFVFGLVIMLGVQKLTITYTTRLFLITGFCGGSSTYSAFTFETVELAKFGNYLLSTTNILLNFLV